MSDFNIDENAMNKLKDMMNKGDLSDVISQIPPEMMQNLSSMMNQSNNNTTNDNSSNNNFNSNSNSGNTNTNSTNQTTNKGNFDFSNLDMNTILKMKTMMEKMNTSGDPRSNLLYSLKPYLRNEKKEKIDQYANLLSFAKIAELMKTDKDNKENKDNG